MADQVLLLDRVGQRAHLLNASAAWVWDLIDGARSAADIAAIIAAETGLDPADIGVDVGTAVERFAASGLLADGSTPVGPPGSGGPGAPGPEGAVRAPALDGRDPLLRCGPYDAIGLAFAVRTDCAEVAEAVVPLLAELAADASTSTTSTTYAVTAAEATDDGDHRYDVRVDDALLAVSCSLTVAVEAMLVDVNRRGIDQARGRLVFHAGAVDRGGVVVLPAASGSGKSTLTAALVARGARYVSDEASVVHPVTLLVDPYPKPLSLSASSLAALADAGFAIADPATGDGEAGKRHVPVAHVGVPAEPGTPLAAMIFPSYEQDGPTSIEPLSPEDALVALVPCTFAATWDVAGALDHVVAMVEAVPAFRLVFSDLADAIALVHRTVPLVEVPT